MEDVHLPDDDEVTEVAGSAGVDLEEAAKLDAEEAINKKIKAKEHQLATLKASQLETKSRKRANESTRTTTTTIPAPPKPESIPKLMDLALQGPRKDSSTAEGSGIGQAKRTTYAANVAKPGAPARIKEVVDFSLHIFGSRHRKTPITHSAWRDIDEQLIDLMAERVEQGQANPGATVAHSGFDSVHGCGFIACRDATSANWFKARVEEVIGPDGESFRAWGKDDPPGTRLCKIFISDRFKRIQDSRIIPILTGLNLFLQGAFLLTPKGVRPAQGGRTVYVEMDMDTYAQIRLKQYKLVWLLGSVDCQGVAPKAIPGPGSELNGPGSKLNKQESKPTSSSTSNLTSTTTSPIQTTATDYDSDTQSSGSSNHKTNTKTTLTSSPLTPVNEARALEEDEGTPAKKQTNKNKKNSKGSKNRKAKNF